MNNPNIEYWLRVSQIEALSPLKIQKLLKHLGHIRAIFSASEKDLMAIGLKSEVIRQLHQPQNDGLKKLLVWMQRSGHFVLTLEDKSYPQQLKTIVDPPPVLFIRGDASILNSPQLAMIGSRQPSPGGLKVAENLAGELGKSGFTIVSGLACGIDGACHRGALLAPARTIAILGSGIDQLYPRRHLALAEQIVENGALVSEFSPNVRPLAMNFPRRNRIISGMSVGVCVVEASLSSGSLITAGLALEQGREVFAVPGSIYNPMTQGCHYLIQQGAKLVTNVQDILSELKQQFKPCCIIPTKYHQLELEPHCHQLLQCVGFETTPVDLLVQRSGFSIAQVTECLITLELNGYVSATLGGYHRIG